MAHFTLSNFLNKVKDSGLSRPARFEVLITPPVGLEGNSGELVSLYCDITNLPRLEVTTKPYRIYGPAYQRPFSSDYGGDGITMTFYLDRKMEVKKFFDSWMHKAVNPTSYDVSYQRDYVSRIIISQLDEQDKIMYSIQLEDAFPKSMNQIDLNMASINQVNKLSVTFAYRRWKTVKT